MNGTSPWRGACSRPRIILPAPPPSRSRAASALARRRCCASISIRAACVPSATGCTSSFHDQGALRLTTLVTGSIAYDTIMVFPDRFRNHLLPDQLHILNVCFLTPEMRREYGGTAGNIAYNLRLLGEDPLVMATVGEDAEPYFERLRNLRISADLLKRIPGQFTAQAFITTDLDNNQIIAFHPGAMNHSHENRITR